MYFSEMDPINIDHADTQRSHLLVCIYITMHSSLTVCFIYATLPEYSFLSSSDPFSTLLFIFTMSLLTSLS